MPKRARRIMSFVLAAVAVFSVIRVLRAYAMRPSRWSTRFVLPAIESQSDDPTAQRCIPDDEDFAILARSRAAMLAAIQSGDVDGYTRSFARDAVTLTAAGVTILGNLAVAAAVGRTLAQARILDAGLTVSSRRTLDGGILEEGSFHIHLQGDHADVLSKGRFSTLWKREMGEWRIVFEAVRADRNEAVET